MTVLGIPKCACTHTEAGRERGREGEMSLKMLLFFRCEDGGDRVNPV